MITRQQRNEIAPQLRPVQIREEKRFTRSLSFTKSQNFIRDIKMTKYSSAIRTPTWLMTAFFALLMFGCGDGGQIFGGGGGAGGPGPAGSAPALGAAATFAGLGGSSAGMTNT